MLCWGCGRDVPNPWWLVFTDGRVEEDCYCSGCHFDRPPPEGHYGSYETEEEAKKAAAAITAG